MRKLIKKDKIFPKFHVHWQYNFQVTAVG